jgi:hypothetical protein
VASKGGLALGGEVEEHVMVSRLLGYRDGDQAWAVTHDPEVEEYGVTVLGTPPSEFAEIHAELAARQAADEGGQVDYVFDVPVRLGEQLCGYAHDTGRLRVWTVLEGPDRRGRMPRGRPAPQVETRLDTEILPELEGLGWTRLREPIMGGLELERVLDGCRQSILVEWQDHPGLLDVSLRFAILVGDAPETPLKIEGRIDHTAPSLWRRIGGRLRRLGAPQTYEARVAAALEQAREDLLAIDRFTSGGPRDPQILAKFYAPAETPPAPA